MMAGNVQAEAKKLHMKCTAYGDAVLASLKNLQQSDELADFTVIAEGRSVRVHKILLAAMSDYFRAMFLGPMKESKESSVDLKGLSADALQHIVDFLYSGEMDLDLDILHDVLNASSHLQVQSAIDLCSDYIISLITFSNSEDFLTVADTYSLTQVIEHYNEKVLRHFEEFAGTEQFLRLGAAQLCSYLSADGLWVKSEVMLYESVARWLSQDETRRQALQQVLRCIRFGLMSQEQLTQLQTHHLTEQCAPAAKFIEDGMKSHKELNLGQANMEYLIKVRSTEQSLILIYQGSSYRPFEITAYNKSTNQFYKLITDMSGSRDCRIVSMNNFLYICRVVDCGGGTLMNSLLRFDPRHLRLVELTPCRSLRLDPCLVGVGDNLYVLGGTTDSYEPLASVERYSLASNAWVEFCPLPGATHSLAGAVCGEQVYVCGGMGVSRQLSACVFAWCASSSTWEARAPLHCARRLHEMLACGGCLYVLGGIGQPGLHQAHIPIETYDPRADQWSLLSSTLAGRSVGHFLLYSGKVLSFGREHQGAAERDIWVYNTATDCWTSFLQVPRHASLTSAYAVLLSINVRDQQLLQRVVTPQI